MSNDNTAEKDSESCLDTGNKALDRLGGVKDKLKDYVGTKAVWPFNWS
jgi:hypothetical protein